MCHCFVYTVIQCIFVSYVIRTYCQESLLLTRQSQYQLTSLGELFAHETMWQSNSEAYSSRCCIVAVVSDSNAKSVGIYDCYNVN